MKDIIIKVNNTCMLRCPYCFASDEAKCEMSQGSIDYLMKFCSVNHVDSVKITGGEPFLFTNINQLINRATEFADVMIFSNLMVEDCFIHIEHPEKVKVLANINRCDFYTEKQYERLLRNLSFGIKTGIHIVPGRTFVEDPYDLNDIVMLCDQYGMNTIRVSQANPTMSRNNRWMHTEEITRFLREMRNVSEVVSTKGIRLDFDCPIAPCIVDDELYSYFYVNDMLSLKCGGKLVIKPDLSIEHCYITSSITKGKKIYEYPSYEAAMEDLDEQLKAFRLSMTYEKCLDCNYHCEMIPCGCYGFMGVLNGE